MIGGMPLADYEIVPLFIGLIRMEPVQIEMEERFLKR